MVKTEDEINRDNLEERKLSDFIGDGEAVCFDSELLSELKNFETSSMLPYTTRLWV